MKMRTLIRIQIIFFFILSVMTTKGLALPSEGFETFGFTTRTSKNLPKAFTLQALYINPIWTSDYQNSRFYFSIPFLGSNYLTSGFSATTANKLNDRSSYFLRYDQTFWGQSISLKLTHIDERFLGTGKNIVTLDYNGAFNVGKMAQLYVVMGIYYRYGLNQWDQNTWSPINFNTSDREYYIEATLGGYISLGARTTVTLDINTRDAFNSYNADFVAFDTALNFPMGNLFTVKLASSTRFSSMFMGTADIGMQTFLLGLTAQL